MDAIPPLRPYERIRFDTPRLGSRHMCRGHAFRLLHLVAAFEAVNDAAFLDAPALAGLVLHLVSGN